MNKLIEIEQKISDLQSYLKEIDLEELRNQFTKEEIKECSNRLYKIEKRNLAYDLNRLAVAIERETVLSLLQIDRSIWVQTMTYLSSEEKDKLKQYLLAVRKGEAIAALNRVTRHYEKKKRIEKDLEDNQVVEKRYMAKCLQEWCDGTISRELNRVEKEHLEIVFKTPGRGDREGILESYLEYLCSYCEEAANWSGKNLLSFKTFYRMK